MKGIFRYAALLLGFVFSLSQAQAGDPEFKELQDRILIASHLQHLDSSIVLLEALHQQSIDEGFEAGIVISYYYLAMKYSYKGNLAKAKSMILRGLKMAKEAGSKNWELGGDIRMAMVYEDQGMYDSSFFYYQKGLKAAREINKEKAEFEILFNTGNLFLRMNDYEQAEKYYEEAINLAKKAGDEYKLIGAIEAKGNLFASQGKPEKAIHELLKLIEPYERRCEDNKLLFVYSKIAEAYIDLKQGEKAQYYQEKYKPLLAQVGTIEDWFYYHLFSGEISNQRKQYNKTLKALEKALAYAIQSKSIYLLRVTKELFSKTHEKLGNFELALTYAKEFSQLQDSILNLEKIELVKDLDEKYQAAVKDQKIAEQDKEMSEARAQNKLMGFSLAFVGILLGIILWIYVQQRRHTKLKEKSHRQEIDQLLQSKELESLNAIMEGQEQERSRLARELHDSLGNMLNTLKLYISGLKEGANQEIAAKTAQVEELTDKVIQETRRISHDIDSGILNEFGLMVALEDLQETVNNAHLIKMELSTYGFDRSQLNSKIEIATYRIIQEAITNAIKHANSPWIHVSINQDVEELTVIIEDGGKGFDVVAKQAVETSKGLGLKSQRARAQKIGAELVIESIPGNGTQIVLEVPLENQSIFMPVSAS